MQFRFRFGEIYKMMNLDKAECEDYEKCELKRRAVEMTNEEMIALKRLAQASVTVKFVLIPTVVGLAALVGGYEALTGYIHKALAG